MADPADKPPVADPAETRPAPEAAEKPAAPLQHAEAWLRGAIISGRLHPNERLIESDLARQLGVGRSVVRTALARLEQDGLVEHERHRGARVRLVAVSEAVEILEARSVLEGLALRHAAERATPEDVMALRDLLARMEEVARAGDLLRVSELNAGLHRELLTLSGHTIALRLISTLSSQMVRFQYRTILLPGRTERSLAEHRAIVDALAAGDPDGAEAAMRAHLTHVADALRQSEPA